MNDFNRFVPKTSPIVFAYLIAATLTAAGLVFELPEDLKAILVALGVCGAAVATGMLLARVTVKNIVRDMRR